METNPTSTALEVLQSVYRVAPESKIFAPLGDAYRRARRLDEAVQVLEQGTSRHPDYVSALVLLALCQMDLGRDAEALVSATQGPGSYTVNFDASRLATGLYVLPVDGRRESFRQEDVVAEVKKNSGDTM